VISVATKTSTDRESRGARKLRDQPNAFLGLFLTPVFGLLMSWFIHAYVRGVDWGPVHTPGSPAAVVVTSCLLTLGAVGLAHAGWHFAEHRKPAFRKALAGSSFAIGALFAISTGIGPHWWWSAAFVIVGWYAATLWSLARLNVTRQDPRSEGGEEKEGVWEKLGLKGFRPKVREQVYDRDGNLERTELEVDHPGETVEPLQSATKNMESLIGAPVGLSDSTPTDRADRSTVTLMHRDSLARRQLYGPPSHPGGSIEDPITIGTYKTGHPVWMYLAGGPVAINPTGYIFMGTSRSGKTQGENQMLTEAITRIDVVILYLNMSKGMQDVRPVLPGIEVAIISDSEQDYKSAFQRVRKLMTYRSNVLGEYGISAWSAKRCYHNPPQRKANGDPVPMDPMPLLVVHTGEADAILERSDEVAIYVASKGLSLGVTTGMSLQRAMSDSMPTALRENLGLRICFGTGNWNSASYVLPDYVLDSGIKPDQWAARFPGRFAIAGPGIEEKDSAKFARTAGIVDGMAESAAPDEHSLAMAAEMLKRTQHYAPRMAKLDRGSAMATGTDGTRCWWDVVAAQTDRLRAKLGVAANPTANMTGSDRKPAPQTAEWETATREFAAESEGDEMRPFTADPAPEGADADTVDARAEVAEEIADLDEFDGTMLYPPDPETGETGKEIDLRSPVERPPAGHNLTWDDPAPEAPSKNDAIAALHDVLRKLLDVPELRDPDDPSGNTVLVRMKDIHAPYPFRKRGWFSTEVSNMAKGVTIPPPSVSVTIAEGFPRHDRRYRLRRVADSEE
jgi:hypothetical protein